MSALLNTPVISSHTDCCAALFDISNDSVGCVTKPSFCLAYTTSSRPNKSFSKLSSLVIGVVSIALIALKGMTKDPLEYEAPGSSVLICMSVFTIVCIFKLKSMLPIAFSDASSDHFLKLVLLL
jgi:hypothetical protein